MKALLVAESSLVIESVSQVLEKSEFEVIVYKWLLKALDNIEEISPHIIIISTKDYPRHWKTLTQFSSANFGKDKSEVVLYAEGGLKEEDVEKAKALNVLGIFESIDEEGLEKLKQILSEYGNSNSTKNSKERQNELLESEDIANKSYDEIPFEEKALQREKDISGLSFMFINPISSCVVTGKILHFHEDSLSFVPDFPNFIENILEESLIEDVFLCSADEKIEKVSAHLKKYDENFVLELFS
ncbi:hypothetical protein [Treponema pectinovorum]|uniref:hypothetical protein n=1 Tax=Treponema pectinovorum TaxID=164 RepID=UPI0011F2FCAC|nr:hypothetical protein [Treponema pectinovorum]